MEVVCAGDIDSLVIEPSVLLLDIDKTLQMRAYRVMEQGSRIDVTRKVVWNSSNEDAATINETGSNGGQLRGRARGETTVTAYDEAFGVSTEDPGGVSAIVTVAKVPTSLRIFPVVPQPGLGGRLEGRAGEILRLKAKVTFRGGSSEGVNRVVNWTSSDPSIIRMGVGSEEDPVNWANLLSPGEARLTITYPGYPDVKGFVDVTVLP